MQKPLTKARRISRLRKVIVLQESTIAALSDDAVADAGATIALARRVIANCEAQLAVLGGAS
jgi:hypothetical protein